MPESGDRTRFCLNLSEFRHTVISVSLPGRSRTERRLIMPLFEYQCRACGHLFEALVRTSQQPACPTCCSGDVERMLSSFAVSSEARSHATLQHARKEFTYSQGRRDQMRHEQETVRDHLQEDYGLKLPKPKD